MLVSKFQDYYDWVFHTYRDEKFHWNRETSNEVIPEKLKEYLTRSHSDIRTNNQKFCQNLWLSYNTKTPEIFLLHREILLIGNSIEFVFKLTDVSNKPFKSTYHYKEEIQEVLKNKGYKIKNLNEFNHIFSPIILLEGIQKIREYYKEEIILSSFDLSSRNFYFYLNPNLSDLKLTNTDAHYILNEVSLYHGLINSPEIVKIQDDVTLRDSKGFDKNSFKTRKV